VFINGQRPLQAANWSNPAREQSQTEAEGRKEMERENLPEIEGKGSERKREGVRMSTLLELLSSTLPDAECFSNPPVI
jgi:hypothetical protein